MCQLIHVEAPEQLTGFTPQHWQIADVDWAFRRLTREDYTTTNFDSLVKNLENNPELYAAVYRVVFGAEEESVPFSLKDPVINQGVLYGIFRNDCAKAVVDNRIYEQVISDYMRTRKLTREGGYPITGVLDEYVEGAKLQIGRVLLKFQAFMKEQYTTKDALFLEREGRLLFLSFLKPIINGRGFAWKEPVTGRERRMDVVVTYGEKQKEVIELKIWRGEAYHQKGLEQLSDYLDFHNLKAGFLLVFDFRSSKGYTSEEILFKDKSIFTVFV